MFVAGGQQTSPNPCPMAAWLHNQDSSAGTETPHDTQREYEAVPATGGKHFLTLVSLLNAMTQTTPFI